MTCCIGDKTIHKCTVVRPKGQTDVAENPPDAPGDAAPAVTLTAAVLLNLLARYDIALIAHVVGPPPDSAAPQRGRLVA